MAPDSMASFLEWKDASVQTGAAHSFLLRLQREFDSAISSRFQPAIISAAPAVEAEPVQAPPPVPVIQPDPVAAPIVRPAAPEPAPRPDTGSSDAAMKEKTLTAQASKVEMVKEPALRAKDPVPAVKPVTAPPPPVVARAPGAEAPGQSRQIRAGLLVQASVDNTWPALLRALEDFGVPLQSSDKHQGMLSSEWIDSKYDKKNQQFTLRSYEGEYWAFSMRGEGLQRHRFQLILVPVDGNRSMIYAYHIGYQEQIDTTPDSSQTLLEWVDRKTDPRIAEAFLQRLRVVVVP
jgi:hypothetical protein